MTPPTAARAAPASFLGKAGPLVLARLFTAALSMSIPLVLARAMSLEHYGTYKQLFLIAQTLYLVLPFGLGQCLYFFIPRSEQRRPYYVHSLLFLLGAGILGAIAIRGGIGMASHYFSNPELLAYGNVTALYTLFLVAGSAFEIGLTSQGKTRQSALVYLVSDMLRACVMVLPVLLGEGLEGAMHGLVIFTAVRTVVCWVLLLREGTGPLFDGKRFVQQLLYAAPFGAAMLLAIPQQFAHQYAVSASVTPELFALYSVGCFQLPIVELLYTPTSEVLMVRLGELEKAHRMSEGVLAFREATAKLALVFFPMAAFLFAAAPEFIGALFGVRFLGAVPIFRVSVIGVAFAVLPMDGVLRARNETRYFFLAYLIKALVTVPLVYFLVPRFGMRGGIAAWACAELIGKLTLLARVPAALSSQAEGFTLRLRDVLPWKDLGRASLAAAAAAAGVFVLRGVSERAWGALPPGFVGRLLPLAVAGLLFGTGYLIALRLTGVSPWGVLSSLRRRRVA